MKSSSGEAARFLVVGAMNTGVGYLFYLAALQFLPYAAAYTVAYALGIVLSYALNTLYVFRTAWSWRRLFAFPAVYLLQYGLGLAVIYLLVEMARFPQAFAPLVVVLVTIPVTFLASRYVIKGRHP